MTLCFVIIVIIVGISLQDLSHPVKDKVNSYHNTNRVKRDQRAKLCTKVMSCIRVAFSKDQDLIVVVGNKENISRDFAFELELMLIEYIVSSGQQYLLIIVIKPSCL